MRKAITLPPHPRSGDHANPLSTTAAAARNASTTPSFTGSRLALYRSVGIANFGGFLVGLHFSLFSGVLEMPHFARTVGKRVDDVLTVSSMTKSLVTAAYILSMAITAPLCGPLIDRVGRRPSLHAIAIVFAASSLATLFSRSVLHIILSRLLAGLAYAVAIVVIPLYTAELSPPAQRGVLINMYHIMVGAGMLFAQVCNILLAHAEWTDPVSLSVFPAMLMLFGVFTGAPESPVWLSVRKMPQSTTAGNRQTTSRNRDDDSVVKDEEDSDNGSVTVTGPILPVTDTAGKTKSSSSSTGKHGGVHIKSDKDSSEVLPDTSKPSSSAPPHRKDIGVKTLWGILCDASARKRLGIGVGLSIAQQMSGINAVFFYAPAIAKDVMQWKGMDASLRATAAIGAANLVACLVASSVIERTGRRTLLLAGAPAMGMSLMIMGAMREGVIPKHGLTGVGALLVYVAAFALTYGPVSFVISSEIFPPQISGTCLSVCMAVFGVFATGISMSFLFVMQAIGGGVFFLFAASLALISVFVWLVVPETQGLTLQQIDQLLDGPYAGSGTPPSRN